jgi:DNA-directed RNA polymerase subunit H (RpoH/RPB5)
MEGDTLEKQVGKAIEIVREMLSDRGQDVRSVDIDIGETVSKRETIQMDIADDTLLVMYVTLRQNGTAIRSDLKKRIERHKRVIMVFREPPINADTILTRLKEDFIDVAFEMFGLGELQYNVTKHVLVPKHVRIRDPARISKILQTYGVKRPQLPIIHRNDVMCRYLAVEIGDMVEVHRTSPTGGVHIAYRMCV